MDAQAELIAYCRESDRVCPQPQRWNELWQMLPNKVQQGNSCNPSLPLILGGWWESSNLDKILRLTEHINYAERHGALQDVDGFLRGLPESEWFHIGD